MTVVRVADMVGSTVKLRDGRTLGYLEYGDPAGRPIFFCHGTPGSRVYRHPDAAIVTGLGVRLIVPDRPGYGLSTFQAGRRLLDWPDDVVQLAEQLGIGQFAMVGISGGGPHTLACAARLGDRLTRVGLLASTAPLDATSVTAGMSRSNRQALAVTRAMPFPILRAIYSWQVQAELRNLEAWLDAYDAQLTPADRAVRTDPAWRQMEQENVREAYRQGSRGHAWEGKLFTQPWGFRLQDMAVPVHLWQGEADTLVPLPMGRSLASWIPNCVPVFLPGVGHLSLFYDHWREILATLIA